MYVEIRRPGCEAIPCSEAKRGVLYEIVESGDFVGYSGTVVFKAHDGDFYDFEGKFRFSRTHPNFTVRRLPTGTTVYIRQEAERGHP